MSTGFALHRTWGRVSAATRERHGGPRRGAVTACVLAAVAVVSSFSSSARAEDTWLVRQDGSGDFTTIQSAVEWCRGGDTVLVGPGTYVLPQLGLDTDGLNIAIVSEAGPDLTVIDATGQNRAFHYRTLEDSTSRIEGFTIRGGNYEAIRLEWASPTVANCRFVDNRRGIYAISESYPTLQGCSFIGCVEEGARISGRSSSSVTDCLFQKNGKAGLVLYLDPEVTVANCSFIDNGERGMSLRSGTGGNGAGGTVTGCTFSGNSRGGLWCEDSSPTITNCVFESNLQNVHGAGLTCTDASAPALTGCRFESNRAPLGGAVYATDASFPSFTDCVFAENDARIWGGAVCADWSDTLTFDRCVFYGNSAYRGGAILCYWSSSVIERCTMVNNGAEDTGGVACLTGSSAEISETIIGFSGTGPAVFCQGGTPTVTRSVIYANAAGDSLCGIHSDNLFVDPLLCDPLSGNVDLCANSPCLPGNNAWGVAVGARGEGCGDCDTQVQPASWGAIKAMFR